MSAPIVVHRPSPTGGRHVTIRDEIIGLAYDDHDLLEFLRRAGLPDDVETLLDNPGWVEWRGAPPHQYEAP